MIINECNQVFPIRSVEMNTRAHTLCILSFDDLLLLWLWPNIVHYANINAVATKKALAIQHANYTAESHNDCVRHHFAWAISGKHTASGNESVPVMMGNLRKDVGTSSARRLEYC